MTFVTAADVDELTDALNSAFGTDVTHALFARKFLESGLVRTRESLAGDDAVQTAVENHLLIRASQGKLDRRDLYALPPWRAALFARVLSQRPLLSRDERDGIVRQAALDSTQPLKMPKVLPGLT